MTPWPVETFFNEKIFREKPGLLSYRPDITQPGLLLHMSLVVRKPAFCICENKGADQLRGNREADQRLCFRLSDSMTPLLSESEISRL